MIDVDGGTVVYRSGLDIYVAGRNELLRVRAAATPIGPSIEAGRVAWAENVGGRGRIRALTAPSYACYAPANYANVPTAPVTPSWTSINHAMLVLRR